MNVEDRKRRAAEAAVDEVRDGMVLGLGTGSTVRHAILRIGRLVRDGWDLQGVATSVATERLAKEAGVPLTTLEEHPDLDLAVDGADEVNPRLDLIKGLGGALFREKVVARAARRFVVVVDDTKVVERLGARTPLPVEVHPFGWRATKAWLEDLGAVADLRVDDGRPFTTDGGNRMLHCRFPDLEDAARWERDINNVPGVLENGLFVGLADLVLVGGAEGVDRLRP